MIAWTGVLRGDGLTVARGSRVAFMSQFSFELLHSDRATAARRGRFRTPRGIVETPAFMPVGTQGTVKGVEVEQLRRTGAQMILANTYHLAIRPGEEIVRRLGGLHEFSGWSGPILTDSGGFQVFSLASQAQVSDHGVTFRSHVDGRLMELTPEYAIRIQQALGSDVMMVLDHVVKLPNQRSVILDATLRTIAWAERSRNMRVDDGQAQFAIVQGGLDEELRCQCADALVSFDFPGYAIGGLSVGEPPEEMYRVLQITCPRLPADRPRYLMGVGRPEDLLAAVEQGVDLFDCVMPTRNGRNALAFTDAGPKRLRNRQYQDDMGPLDPSCICPACQRSMGYLRHLFASHEMLGPILLSIHNLTYYQRLMGDAREAIELGRFGDFRREKLAGWQGV